jgi:hypothetical protein
MGPSPLAGLLALKNVRFSILWDLLPLKTSLNLPIEFSEVGWTRFYKGAPVFIAWLLPENATIALSGDFMSRWRATRHEMWAC